MAIELTNICRGRRDPRHRRERRFVPAGSGERAAVNQMPAPPGALTPPHGAATAARALRVQRSPPDTAPTSTWYPTLLVADPRAATRVPLSVGLHATGIGRVLNADSVAEVHEVIARGVTGDVALISVEFGPATGRLIHDLHRAGWPRVLVTTPPTTPTR